MASITFSSTVFLSFFLLCSYKAINLYRNVQEAKKTGLPYAIVPFIENEAIAKFLTPILRWIYHDYLLKGEGWPHWCRFIIRDWAWEDKRRAHDEYGEVFLCVSAEGIMCYSADAIMGWDVMNRRTEFTKPRDKYKMLEMYGPNVTTAEGKDFSFHARMTAPTFSDANGANNLVWKETMEQTERLTDAWSKETTRKLQLDINALTLSVLSLTAYGKKLDWTSKNEEKDKPSPGYKISFLKALHDATSYIVVILLFPRWLLSLSPWREAAVANQQLTKYMREIIRTEEANLKKDGASQSRMVQGNLLTSLLRASAAADADSRNPNTKKLGFTEDEVMGNLFIFTLAGYETTANAITYALILLAIRPDLQYKVRSEIHRIYAEAASEGRTELTYADDFEKFEYTYGFMYESFRLYPGGIIVTKKVDKPTSIIVSSTTDPNAPPTTHILPKYCRVYLSAPAVHYTERYWPNCTELDPSRWFETVTVPSKEKDPLVANKKVTASDKSRQVRGSFLTFSGGARACLGRKFAQSEFISFLATLLKDHEVVLGPGMDPVSVQRDIDLRSAGKLTLCPLDNIKLALKRAPASS